MPGSSYNFLKVATCPLGCGIPFARNKHCAHCRWGPWCGAVCVCSGRRLHWQNSLAHCVVRAQFDKGPKELSVSLFQTVVLMLFNDADSLSFRDIITATVRSSCSSVSNFV